MNRWRRERPNTMFGFMPRRTEAKRNTQMPNTRLNRAIEIALETLPSVDPCDADCAASGASGVDVATVIKGDRSKVIKSVAAKRSSRL